MPRITGVDSYLMDVPGGYGVYPGRVLEDESQRELTLMYARQHEAWARQFPEIVAAVGDGGFISSKPVLVDAVAVSYNASAAGPANWEASQTSTQGVAGEGAPAGSNGFDGKAVAGGVFLVLLLILFAAVAMWGE